jgi:HAD superfamily hydrolase (TIGR01490 family)
VHRIAFYDLDRTVTRLPTWSAFLVYGAMRLAPWRLALAPVILADAVSWRARLTSRDRLKQRMHRRLLGKLVSTERLASLGAAFAERTAMGNIRPGARRAIARDRGEGYRIVLATAAHRFYAQPIARRLDIGDVIATEAMTGPGGVVLSTIDGDNVYGGAKLAAIKAWLHEQGIARGAAHVRFYSDHASDVPSLEFADEPFAVNPHGRLRRIAVRRGWPILDWQQGTGVDPARP